MRVIVDAFGGDNAPLEILKGCEMAIQEYGIEVVLCGSQSIIEKVAEENQISLQGMAVSHTTQIIEIGVDPMEMVKSYEDCSMARGLKHLAAGEGDAFVSAGSTAALVVGSTLIVRRIKGIKRPTLATLIPNSNGCYMLTDAGANHECRPEMLVQFAIMASAYMERVMNISNPRIGLVNIGAEETKGLLMHTTAYQMLQGASINFIGNVEARGLPLGECDVAVADGFTGNVILKLTEGLGSFFAAELKNIFTKNMMSKAGAMMVAGGIRQFKQRMDYTEYGGAPLLGLTKPVIKAHGSSNAKSFKNAIRQAKEFFEKQVITKIEDGWTGEDE